MPSVTTRLRMSSSPFYEPRRSGCLAKGVNPEQPLQFQYRLFISQPLQPPVELNHVATSISPRPWIQLVEIAPKPPPVVHRKRRMHVRRVKRAVPLTVLV